MTKFKLAMVAGAMVLAACGGNNETEGNNANVNNTGNTTTDTTGDNNNNNNNNTGTTGTTTGTTGGTTGGTTSPPVEFPTPPNCDDTPQPARCTEDPAAVTWGPASVIDTFWVAGTADDPECCYDFGGVDDDIDNALGMTLAGIEGVLDDVNNGIEESITTGSLVLLLEHNGITDLATSDPYEVNFFVGAHADRAAYEADGFDQDGANAALINPQSFDDGAHPQAYLPEAELDAGALTAGPGAVKVQLELFGTVVELTISLARTDAEVRNANSALDETGIALQNGNLGGVVRVSDVFEAVNNFAATSCSCLGIDGEDLLDGDAGQCNTDADATSCDDACTGVKDNCSVIALLGVFADIDADSDNIEESISVGAFYTAVGATITGVE